MELQYTIQHNTTLWFFSIMLLPSIQHGQNNKYTTNILLRNSFSIKPHFLCEYKKILKTQNIRTLSLHNTEVGK